MSLIPEASSLMAGQGRVAVVTGAGQGLGAAIARRLHTEDYRLALSDLPNSPGLDAIARECDALRVEADAADPEAVTRLIDTVTSELGDIGVLVANHAAMSMGPFVEAEPATWWRQVHVNLSGTFRLCQAVVPSMRRLGGGRIVLVASEAGVVGMANATGYSASKGGLLALAKSLGRELAPDGIITNAVAPSYVDTPQLQVDADDAGVSLEEMRKRYAALIPLGRIAAPEEIAAVVAFLAGPYAGSYVGQVIQPNGGTTRTRG